MEHTSTAHNLNTRPLTLVPASLAETAPVLNKKDELNNIFQQFPLPNLEELLASLVSPSGKKSFLVFKQNKYLNIPTENIAFFYVRYESSVIMCFDKQEYFVKQSLEQIQNRLPGNQFFRLNRQYLISFNSVKEVEHYRARKLLINPVIPLKDQLLVPKRKVTEFLNWMDNR